MGSHRDGVNQLGPIEHVCESIARLKKRALVSDKEEEEAIFGPWH
jgi:hypothetical protein